VATWRPEISRPDLTQFIVTALYMYKKQQNLFLKTYAVLPVVCLHLAVPE
jgi:hypothetical protein